MVRPSLNPLQEPLTVPTHPLWPQRRGELNEGPGLIRENSGRGHQPEVGWGHEHQDVGGVSDGSIGVRGVAQYIHLLD